MLYLLWFLGLGVDVPKHSDIREVNSELGQESCHPGGGGEGKRGRKRYHEISRHFNTRLVSKKL